MTGRIAGLDGRAGGGRASRRIEPRVAVAVLVLVGMVLVHWLATVFVSTPQVRVAGEPAGLPSWLTWPVQLAALTVLAGGHASDRRVPRSVVTFLLAWVAGLVVLLANGYSRDVVWQVLLVVLEPLPYVAAYLFIVAGRPGGGFGVAGGTDGDGRVAGRPARLGGRFALPVFLWHQTVPVIVALATTRLGPLPGLNAVPTASGWWPARLAWLPVLAAVLAGLVALAEGAGRGRPAR
ncbi:hypothetical protein [Nonomuraea rubra]|uniref:Acyltransferase n=1 Tax=Nonomuraea rubra TaxID=46180 RepID=A0A7X0NUT0_9ACTN|nr:hypothetical protein [Nonomuraea rubra]MBB6550032.1 hypothetical protein [Nonomuraea rubra]